MAHIFISYSHQDYPFVIAELVPWLEAKGFPIWLDTQSLRPGDIWKKSIDEGIHNAFAVIVVLTPAAMRSKYVAYEWAFALGSGAIVLPLIKERVSSKHPRLEELQHVDLTGEPSPTKWESLVKVLESARSQQENTTLKRSSTGRKFKTSPPTIHKTLTKTLINSAADVDSRAEAARSLGELGAVDYIPTLLGILFDHKNLCKLRESCASALSRLASAEFLSAATPLLHDRCSGVRQIMIDAMSKNFQPAAAPALLNYAYRYSENPNYVYRRKALQIIRLNIDTPTVRDILMSRENWQETTRALDSLRDAPDEQLSSWAKIVQNELSGLSDSQF